MKKKNLIDKKKLLRIIVSLVIVFASSSVMYFWTPDIWQMGNYFLIRFCILFSLILLIYVVYGYLILPKLSKKYPKYKLLGWNILSLFFESLVFFEIFTILIHFEILNIDIYSFSLFLALIILSLFQKFSMFGLLVDAYRENQGENFQSLLLEVKMENKPIFLNFLVCLILMFLPISILINAQLGISLGIIGGGLVLLNIGGMFFQRTNV